MSKQKITLNRRFRRDLRQLSRQGHNITYRHAPNGRSLIFSANYGPDMTPSDLMREAAIWRKPLSAEQVAEAEAEAAELHALLKWVDELPA